METSKNSVFVALLRGINVGGNNKVDMARLKNTFERVGMKHVTTYINSGNIIFVASKTSENKIERILEEAIRQDFNLSIKVLIRNMNQIEGTIKKIPKNWKNDSTMKSDVMFLWEDVDNKDILKKLTIRSTIDHVIYTSGALLWSVNAKNITKSGKMKLPGTEIYQKMTIRNVNTARKIYELMKTTASL